MRDAEDPAAQAQEPEISGRRSWLAAASFVARVLDVVFPGRCLVCGQELVFSAQPFWPLCLDCKDIIHPLEGRRCRLCSVVLLSETDLCTRCRQTDYHFFSNHSLFEYRGVVKELIYQFKFNRRRRVALVFAHFLADAYAVRYSGLPVVPVPPRSASMRRRGWDHVEQLALMLKRQHGVAVLRCLKRVGGRPQKSLSFQERLENIQGRIRLKRTREDLPESVVLLDDLFTTGATADECSRVLSEAGVGRVFVLTVALD